MILFYFVTTANVTIILLLPNSGSGAHCSKASSREANVGRKESCLIRKPAVWGKGGLMSPKNNSEDSAQP